MIGLVVSFAEAATTKYIRDDATGGDCTSVGTWNSAAKTCYLTSDLNLTNIIISNNGITLDGGGHSLTGSGTSGGYGVDLIGRSSVTVKNLVISSFNYGIYAYSGSGNWVTGNQVSSTNRGIYVRSSNGNVISGNVTSSSSKGIALLSAANNSVTGNMASGNTFGIELSGSGSTGNTVSSNIVNSNSDGIYLVNSPAGNVIGSNMASGNTNSGIHLISSVNNTITANTCSSDLNGLFLEASSNDNTIKKNIVSGNGGKGIQIDSSNDNTVVYNSMSGNGVGFSSSVSSTANNQIYNNGFINNATQVSSNIGAGNFYNKSAPVGGNYFSNYDTEAEGCFDLNGDGFCDSPYVFWNGQDNLPWTRDNGWCSKPNLSLKAPQSFWASYSDYIARELSVSWTISNNGGLPAYDVKLTSSANTSGVTLITPLPVAFGDIAGAGQSTSTVKYQVPAGIASWLTANHASAVDACGTLYVYP
ncbi:MAG: right-handed parallel beta-helix repeat-containing protein [Thermoleophilia bacterium]